ncbi:nuclear pore protein 84/107 [Schizophyllum commune]
MAESLYASYADILSVCQGSDDPEELLDPETGFASRLRRLCDDRLQEYEEHGADPHTLELLRLERNTWALLQLLTAERRIIEDNPPRTSAAALLAENPYTPTVTVVNAILASSPMLRELVVIREWVQDFAPPPPRPESTTGYLRGTKNALAQAARMGAPPPEWRVQTLDPDATHHGDEKTLDPDDMNYEKALAQALYRYIRAGRTREGADLCRDSHHPWRAACINGSILFEWPALCTRLHIHSLLALTLVIAIDPEDAEEDIERDILQGNRNRRLWKRTCTRAALSTRIADYDRIVFAALAPSPQTSGVLKMACRTWEDHLWTQVAIVFEEKISTELNRLGGGFWEGGLLAAEEGVHIPTPEEEDQEEQEWEREMALALKSLETVKVEEGPDAQHPFYFSQLKVIQGRTRELVELFAAELQRPETLLMAEYPVICRFFAHLCLFLKQLNEPVPPLAAQVIFESYLRVLEDAGERDLIALYASVLGDNAVERYAMFLVSLELSSDRNERRAALHRAQEHGLDIARVAIATAEQTIGRALELLPSLRGPLPPLNARQPPPSDEELLLARSIEWTTFMDATFPSALEHANLILRRFLAGGRITLARSLMEQLPVELANIRTPEERATEYMHYMRFLKLWDLLERCAAAAALETPDMGRDARKAWLTDYKALLDQAWEEVVHLLTVMEWLVVDVEAPGGDARRRELIRIRQTYIPDLVMRIHTLMLSSRQHVPGNLKRALSLANIVADSRYKVYDDFVNEEGRRLSDYLKMVRDAAIAGLENGGSDPFRVVM